MISTVLGGEDAPDIPEESGDERSVRVDVLSTTGTAWDGSAIVRIHCVFTPYGLTFTEPSQTTRCYHLSFQR